MAVSAPEERQLAQGELAMGTSSDNKGAKQSSKLVPDHADANPGAPQPNPEPARFRQFRTSMRKYASSGDSSHRDRALGSYSRSVAGGAATGARKFGAVARSGAAALVGLADLGAGGDASEATGSDLSGAIGADVDVAAQLIAEAIAPQSESRDQVRVAIIDAVCSALEGEDTLEQGHITEDLLNDVLHIYLADAVFQEVWNQAGDSTDGAEASDDLEKIENDLRAVIGEAIDIELEKVITGTISAMTQKEIEQAQIAAVRLVLQHWENADD
jgi:hypothetical protein